MISALIPNRSDAGTLSLEPPAPWPRWAIRLAWILLAIGAILRIARWIHWRALWLDELFSG